MSNEAHVFAALIRKGIARADLVLSASEIHEYVYKQISFQDRWGEKCDIGSYGSTLIFEKSMAEIAKPVNVLRRHLMRNKDKIDVLLPQVMHIVTSCAYGNEELEQMAVQQLTILPRVLHDSENDVVFVTLW